MERIISLTSVYPKRTKSGIVFLVDDNLNKQIRLEVSASKESWKALRHFFIDNKDQFNETFYRKFILPGFLNSTAKLPRGVHSKTWEFDQKIGMAAPCVFSVIDYCLKVDKQPDSMKKLLQRFKAEALHYSHSGKPLRPNALGLTAYLLEKAYGQERARIKRKSESWTIALDTFSRSYLTPNRRLIKIYQEHIETFLDHPTDGLPQKIDLLNEKFLRKTKDFSLFLLFSQKYSLRK